MFDKQKETEKIKRRMREIENGSEETHYKEYNSLSWKLGSLKVTDGALFQE